MREICKGRTVFIIAHRLSTVRACDRIIVMNDGSVIESGSHQELIQKQGEYEKLHRLQSGLPVSIRTPTNR